MVINLNRFMVYILYVHKDLVLITGQMNYPHLEDFPIDKALNLKTQAFEVCFDSLMSVD